VNSRRVWNYCRGRGVPRYMRLRYVLTLFVVAVSATWIWTKLQIPCLEPPTVRAQDTRLQDLDWPPPFSPTQKPPSHPPFAAMGIQLRWDYSDLVCTGSAEEPRRTGRFETLGGSDRDQLASWVVLESCFKGTKPNHQIQVFGDSVFAEKDIHGGFLYAGPPTGFVARGRNLLFLRKTDQPYIWRVTVPVYATCIQLADEPASYTMDGSDDSIRRALTAEMEAMIDRGELRPTLGAMSTGTEQPDRIAAEYLRYIFEILGRKQALREFAGLMQVSSPAVRREIAMEMLRSGDQRGVTDSLALLEDANAPDWQRANAARALAHATSPPARSALERIARGPGNQELVQVAQESLSQMQH
jgi:hypothetical protein